MYVGRGCMNMLSPKMVDQKALIFKVYLCKYKKKLLDIIQYINILCK